MLAGRLAPGEFGKAGWQAYWWRRHGTGGVAGWVLTGGLGQTIIAVRFALLRLLPASPPRFPKGGKPVEVIYVLAALITVSGALKDLLTALVRIQRERRR
jgi:hypothetical protein